VIVYLADCKKMLLAWIWKATEHDG